MKICAFVVKGLEEIAVKEINTIFPESEILQTEDKLIIFDPKVEDPFEALQKLTTVDDVAILAGEVGAMYEHKHDSLAEQISLLDFSEAMGALKLVRDVDINKFSLTVSLPGFDTLKAIPFKNHLAKFLSEKKGWIYQEMDHSNFDIRIFKGSENIVVAVKIFDKSLFRRDYKTVSRRGSLRPTVAAALVEFATLGKKGKLVDSFCGSGTILCEALLKGNDVFGGDIDKKSVDLTLRNLSNLDFQNTANIFVQDAASTGFDDHFFDFAVSNLPWGGQIDVDKVSIMVWKGLMEYKRIVKEDGVICLLTRHPDVVESYATDMFPTSVIESFTISMVGQQPEVVRIKL